MSERNVSSRVDEQESHCLRVPSFHYGSGGLISFESSVVQELVVRLVVNGQQADTLTCSPWNVEELTYGRLYFNGIIRRASDVTDMRIDVDAGLVDVLISGTMGAASDSLLGERSVLSYVTPRWIIDNMAQFEANSCLFRRTGGMHGAAIADAGGFLARFDDVGRHNAMDKLVGWCLTNSVDASDKVVLFSGRVPWGIIDRVVKLGAYAIVSPGAPTDMSIKTADRNQIMLVGFTKNGEFNIYAHEELLSDRAEKNAVLLAEERKLCERHDSRAAAHRG